MNGSDTVAAGRGMASIAHLFLSQAEQRPPLRQAPTAMEAEKGTGRPAAEGKSPAAEPLRGDGLTAAERLFLAGETAAGASSADGAALVLVSGQGDDVLRAYAAIKQWAQRGPQGPLGVLVHAVASAEEGRGIFERIAGAAQRFLNVELVSAGCHVGESDGEVVVGGRWLARLAAQAGFLVLGEEDATSLGAGEMSPQPTAASVIPVADYPADDEQLGRAVADNLAAALPELGQARDLSAFLPADYHGGIVLCTPEGGLYALAASVSESEALLGRALALRQWVVEHETLLRHAGGVPEAVAGPGGLVLVTPAAGVSLPVAQLEGFPVIVKRWSRVIWADQRGLVLI